MGKHSRCVTGTCNNDMQYPELHKKHSNVDGDKIMHKLPTLELQNLHTLTPHEKVENRLFKKVFILL